MVNSQRLAVKSQLKLVDSHTHVNFRQFDQDRPEVIKRSFDKGIGMINVGTDLEMSQSALELAKQHKGKMWATVGIHPNDAPKKEFPEKEFLEMVKDRSIVGIGETGLDFYRTKEKEKQARQYEFFERHIELANQVGKPITIHVRAAYKEAIVFLKQQPVAKGGVMHCFGGSVEEARAFLDLGFYISFAGNITYGNNFVETIKYVPLDRLLVETDAPYLAPVPHRGKRNEPAFVEIVAKKVAEIKDISFEEVAGGTLQNTARLFGLIV